MASIIAVIFAGLTGAAMTLYTKRAFRSWLASCAVVPLFILTSEFFLPYAGGGASMWPIALSVGGVGGALAGAFGVALASTALDHSGSA